MEKTVKQNKVFHGKILDVFCDEALAENGTPCVREYIRHNGGVCVLAVFEGKIAFVKQYRYSIGREFLELPAGKLEKGEDPYQAGLRELHEETGLVAQNLIPMGTIIPTVGYSNEVIHLYRAQNLTMDRPAPDADECLNLVWIDVNTALSMATDGSIEDAKSVALLLRARDNL